MFDLFMQNCYLEAIELKNKFKITEDKEWTALTVTNELFVQLGHYSFVVCNNNYTEEIGRNINNSKDELADILLQLCALCGKLNIDKEKIKYYDTKIESVNEAILQLVTLIGQLTETIMELEGYRHNKERIGYVTKKDFIIERINKCFSIVFWIANKEKYDMVLEFNKMKVNALDFLKKYKEEKYDI